MKRYNMKAITHKIFSFAVGVALLAGCGDTTNTPSATSVLPLTEQEEIKTLVSTISQKTTFLLTDAPSDDFQSVMVDVLSPIVITREGGATIDVPLPEGLPLRVDLLELDEISDHLALADLPAGKIIEVRLKVANPVITKLDGTVLDTSKIDLPDNALIVRPDPPIDVVTSGEGTTVEIDVDVASSISIDVNKGDRPIFRPRGLVRKLVDVVSDRREDEKEAKRVHGVVAEIPIKDHPKSFLLKYRGDRRHFIPVDASMAEVYTLDGDVFATTTFAALAKGKKVGVGGIWTQRGFLKARKIFILPEDHRVIRGVITNLNLRESTFDLVFHHRDRDLAATTTATSTRLALAPDMATNTDAFATSSIKVHMMERTKILFDGPHGHVMELGKEALTNGQRVGVHGVKRPDSDLLHAAVIVVHPENFRAFVAEKRCDALEIRVVKPFAELHRLEIAGVKPLDNSGIVEFTKDTKFIGLDGNRIECANLERGMAIRIFGRMIPHTPDRLDPIALPLDPIRPFLDPNPIRVKAFIIKKLPAEMGRVKGVVVAVNAENPKDFTLRVPADKVNGFDRVDTVCATMTDPRSTDERCFFRLHVTLMDRVATDTPALDDHIMVAGVFHGHKEIDHPHPHFHAFRIEKVVLAAEPVKVEPVAVR